MNAVRTVPLEDEFESAVLAELEEIRRAEKALQRMYPRLKSKPHLRPRFLQRLADMQHRANRLDVVLNPFDALRFVPPPPMPAQSSVA